MTKNMGTVDRIIRIVVALAIIVLILTGVVSGWVAIILGVLTAVFVLTSIVSFCPLYAPFHISTNKE